MPNPEIKPLVVLRKEFRWPSPQFKMLSASLVCEKACNIAGRMRFQISSSFGKRQGPAELLKLKFTDCDRSTYD